MLLAYAEKLCRDGQRVLYVTRDWRLAHNCFLRVEESVYGLPGFQAFRANGKQRITHESGGEVRFMSIATEGRGFTANTLILDDVDPVHADSFRCVVGALPDARMVMASL